MSHKIKTSVEVDGSLSASQIANATTDTDKFLVSDNGLVKYRTGSEVLSDLGITLNTASILKHIVKAGVSINKGQAVYVTGADGTNMVVGLASNISEATSSKTMGLLDANVAINGFANVVTEGLIDGLNTSMANAGDSVWLGTGGNLIYGLSNKPSAPDHLVFIGIVTRVNANNGEIFVKVQNGFELNEIHDVDLKSTTPSGNDILAFEGAPVNLWKNKTIPSVLGYTPVPTTRTITINGSTQDLSANRTFSIDTGVTSFNTRTGAITLSSGDVTGALGYTPYNASNPAGYISSYTETDPTVPSYVKAITTTNISNWNTAFGWGNHALAGYVPGARTITINGTTQDLSANRSFTVTAVEVDTLATVTARGNTTSTGVRFNNYVDILNQNSVYWYNSGNTIAARTYFDGGTFNLDKSLWVTANIYGDIFYDRNDSAYYLDPNGTSRLKLLSVSDTGSTLTVDPHTVGIDIHSTGNIAPHYQTDFSWYTGAIGSGTNRATLNSSGDFTANNSLRSPIFYDLNNTAYYGDFASTSRINTIQLDTLRGPQGDWLLGYQSGTTYSFGSTAVSDTLNIDFNSTNFANGTSWFGGYGSGSGPGLAFENQGTFARIVFFGLDFYEWDYGLVGGINNGYIYSNTSFRAPIFYDSNNTGYYVDPAGTSNVSTLVGASLKAQKSQSDNNYTTAALWTESYNNTTTGIAFHISNVVGKFLEMRTNGLLYWDNTRLITENGGSWGINVTGTAGGVSWGNVSSKPSYIMYYQGFTLNADTMDSNATGFTYGVNAPFVGPIVKFSTGGGYDLQINSPYGGGNGFAFRTRNGDGGFNNAWRFPAVYDVNANGGGSLFSTIYYDQSDTGTYLDPNSTGTSLRINGEISLPGVIRLRNGGETSTYISEGYGIRLHGANIQPAQVPNASFCVGFGASGGGFGSGNGYFTGDVTAYYSDKRLKHNLVLIDNAIEKVKSLNGYTYQHNELGQELLNENPYKTHAGLIAQEVQAILPEVVTIAPFDLHGLDEQGNGISKSGENYLTIKYERIVPLLIEAIKEQQTQIEELKELVNKLINK